MAGQNQGGNQGDQSRSGGMGNQGNQGSQGGQGGQQSQQGNQGGGQQGDGGHAQGPAGGGLDETHAATAARVPVGPADARHLARLVALADGAGVA